MADAEKVIKGLEEAEIMLTQAVDRGGEMAVMGAFKCLNSVTGALALLKAQESCEDAVSRDAVMELTQSYGPATYDMPYGSGDMIIRPEDVMALPAVDSASMVGHWISVKDRLPDEKENWITKDYQKVICCCDFGGDPQCIDVRTYGFGNGHFWHGPQIMDEVVTHWMPLPEPPKEVVKHAEQ